MTSKEITVKLRRIKSNDRYVVEARKGVSLVQSRDGKDLVSIRTDHALEERIIQLVDITVVGMK
jgi:hypothetical protein